MTVIESLFSGLLLGTGVYLGALLACWHVRKHFTYNINISVVQKKEKDEEQEKVETNK